MNDIIVRLVDIPVDVRGIIKEDSNGDFNIYINARYCEEEQLKTYLHELAHARLGHLRSDKPTDEIEKEAEMETPAMLIGDSALRAQRG